MIQVGKASVLNYRVLMELLVMCISQCLLESDRNNTKVCLHAGDSKDLVETWNHGNAYKSSYQEAEGSRMGD